MELFLKASASSNTKTEKTKNELLKRSMVSASLIKNLNVTQLPQETKVSVQPSLQMSSAMSVSNKSIQNQLTMSLVLSSSPMKTQLISKSNRPYTMNPPVEQPAEQSNFSICVTRKIFTMKNSVKTLKETFSKNVLNMELSKKSSFRDLTQPVGILFRVSAKFLSNSCISFMLKEPGQDLQAGFTTKEQ